MLPYAEDGICLARDGIAEIAPGATVTVSTSFSNPSMANINYTPKVFSVTY